jgi:hypothetical protein
LTFYSLYAILVFVYRENRIYGGSHMAKGSGGVIPGKGPAKGEMPMKKGEMPVKGGKGCDGCGGKKKGK